MTHDKLLHLAAGCVLSLAALALCGTLAALVIGIVAGVAKEAWDATGDGTVDPWDAVATAAPGFVMWALL